MKNASKTTQHNNGKAIMCDGVFFKSQKLAADQLAPATRLTEKSKKSWVTEQMKKYPDRYFYIGTPNIKNNENRRVAIQKLYRDPVFKQKNHEAIQKACNKPISCDGVIYESATHAALALAPEIHLTINAKRLWLINQRKKNPARYFYI